MPNLALIPGTLPAGYCYPANPQEFYNAMFELGIALQPVSLTGVLLQEAEPTIEQRDFVWARLAAGQPANPFLWMWYDGAWLAKHPVAANDLKTIIYTGAAGSIDTLDGGATGVVTATTGPFWTIDTTLSQRIPIGVGTLPDAGTVLNIGDVGGIDEVILTAANLPAANVAPFGSDGEKTNILTVQQSSTEGEGGSAGQDLSSSGSLGDMSNVTLKIDGSDEPHTNMPPYRAVYFLKRTARIFLTAPLS